MIGTLLRGIPYYFVFFLLFLLFKKYNKIVSNVKAIGIGAYGTNIPSLVRFEDRRRKRLLNRAYLLLFFFLGLRGYVYTDFVNYKPFFDMLEGFSNLTEVLLLKGWEPGFVIYTALCKTIIPNYFVWNAISTIIDLFLLYKILERYSSNHLMSLMVFFVIGAMPLEFNVLRNAKAIFLFLYALRFIEERQMWKYIVVISIACLFHISSIVYFPLYFILHKKWPKWFLWTIYIAGAVIVFFQINIVSDIISRISFAEESRLEHLTNHLDDLSGYSSLFGNIERLITMLIVILLYNKIANNNGNCMFVNMYVLVYASFMFCSASAVMVQRFQYMFIAAFWILYPLLIKYAKQHKNQMVYIFVTALLAMKLLIIASNPHLLYENVITGVSDFDAKVNYVEQNF